MGTERNQHRFTQFFVLCLCLYLILFTLITYTLFFFLTRLLITLVPCHHAIFLIPLVCYEFLGLLEVMGLVIDSIYLFVAINLQHHL